MDRELIYEQNGEGSFLLFFQHGKKMVLDAIAKDNSFGRLINYSAKEANSLMKVVVVAGKPRVIFIVLKDVWLQLVTILGLRSLPVLCGLTNSKLN